MIGIYLYMFFGFIYTLLEYRIFRNDDLDEESPKTIKFLYFIQMINHLLRTFTVWPMYFLEDMIIISCNLIEGDDGDIDGP